MGCDIHLCVERYEPEIERWVLHRTFDGLDSLHGFTLPAARKRNYNRFSALAGVRGDGPEALGLPMDCSVDTRAYMSCPDYHSHSWKPIEDAAQVFLDTEFEEIRKRFEGSPAYFYFGYEAEIDGRCRVVFAFDN